MSNESSPKCPQCGTPLPVDAPKGLCPNCLMALNLKTETVFTGDTPAAQPPLPAGQIAPHFPQLEIFECLGRGGMGVVYKARQKTLNRFVALKLLAPERVNDTQFAERFTREAQALAALNHPNIVTIYDFGQAGGFYYLLMEFVDGLNLRQLLRTRKFTPEEALAIVPPLCDALQFAHERGIVHRDIKPENLLLDKSGRVKVADFGIAKMLGTAYGNGHDGEPAAPENATRSAVGTPSYSAPEQKTDPQRVDSRADIYSLGVVFYEMLTGELPGKRIEAPSKKVQIDVRLDEVVMRALAKTPELRWQTAAALRTQVETIAGSTNAKVSQAEPPDLKEARWKIMVWGLVLALACIEMGIHLTPVSYGWVVGIWGVLLFIISAPLILVADCNLKKTKIAALIVSIDGIGVAGAGIWCACHAWGLDESWSLAIIAGCISGIIYALRALFYWTAVETIAQTSHPEILPRSGSTSDNLDRRRWKIVIWGLALAAAGCNMNSGFGILGVLLFMISAALALVSGDKLKMLQIAGRIVMVDGIIMASAGIGFALKATDLSMPWLVTVVAGCLLGIGYCLFCWAKLNMLTAAIQNPKTGAESRLNRRFRKIFLVQLPVAFVILMVIRIFLLQPFKAGNDAAAPEIPRGSQFLVWKLAHNFAPGDLVAYRHNDWASVGRVVRNEGGVISVNRNGKTDITVPSDAILGKVISVYWRASNGASSAACLQPNTDGKPGFFKSPNRAVEAHAVSLATLMNYAYGQPKYYIHWSGNRVILPPDVADGKFDFSIGNSDHPQEALQAEIKKQLGLVAHRESREADVLVLTVSNPDVIGLAAASGGNGSDNGAAPGRSNFEFTNMPIDDLSDFLEVSLGRPVVNGTELTQKFSGRLKWNPQPDKTAELKEVQNALSDQLGLRLVPNRQPIEFLVVEKVK